MRTRNLGKPELLESRLCLSASAGVNDGNQAVSRDAGGAVATVVVGAGAIRLGDNGFLIVDETTVLAATSEMRAELEADDAAVHNTVSVDRGGQTVDCVYAELGEGDNSAATAGNGAGEHGLAGEFENSIETLVLNRHNLGFFYRGFRR